MEEKRTDILSDDGDVIEYADVTTVTDSVSRKQVADIEESIEKMGATKADIEARIAGLNDEIAKAKEVIALADAKASEAATETETAEAVEAVETEAVEEAVETPAPAPNVIRRI